MTKLAYVLNPAAGSSTAGPRAAEALALLASHFELIDCSAANFNSALLAAKAALEQPDVLGLVVAGGDGMVHLGVNAVAVTGKPLGILPVGTGNDAAQKFGYRIEDPVACARQIISGQNAPISVDFGRGWSQQNEFRFAGSLSAGFDALVNRRANGMTWPKGQARYQVAMLLELAKFKPIRYRLEVDGQSKTIDAMLCAITNNGQFGAGMKIVPDASVDDGLIDLFIVHAISRFELIKIFPKVYSGGHIGHPAVEIVRAKEIVISAEGMPGYADGEFIGDSPIRAQVLAGGLKLLLSNQI